MYKPNFFHVTEFWRSYHRFYICHILNIIHKIFSSVALTQFVQPHLTD